MVLPIGWLLVAAIAGFGVGLFCKEIKAWVIPVIGSLIDKMNKLVEYLVGGAVFLIKEGRKFYKTAYLFTQEGQKSYRRESDRVEIKETDIPSDLRAIVPEKTNNKEVGVQVLTLAPGAN